MVFSLTLLSSGCFLKQKDLGQMLFPISLGVSYEDDKYSVYLQILDTSTLSIVETESSSRETSFVLIHAEDKDLSKALGNLGLKALTYISAIKIKSIVLHKSIFDDSPLDYHDLANYFINTPLFRTRVQLFVTETKLKDFYSVQYMLVGASVYSHANEEEPQIIRGYTKPAFLLDSLKSNSENKRMYHFPIMNLNEESIDSGDPSGKTSKVKAYKYDGICFTTYNEKKKYDCLSKEEALGYRLYSEVGYITEDLGDMNNPINILLENINWKNKIENNVFVIDLKLKASISLNISDYTILEIKEKLKEKINKIIFSTLSFAYEKNIDIYHLNDYAYRKNRNIKYNLENVNSNIQISITNTNYYKN